MNVIWTFFFSNFGEKYRTALVIELKFPRIVAEGSIQYTNIY